MASPLAKRAPAWSITVWSGPSFVSMVDRRSDNTRVLPDDTNDPCRPAYIFLDVIHTHTSATDELLSNNAHHQPNGLTVSSARQRRLRGIMEVAKGWQTDISTGKLSPPRLMRGACEAKKTEVRHMPAYTFVGKSCRSAVSPKYPPTLMLATSSRSCPIPK